MPRRCKGLFAQTEHPLLEHLLRHRDMSKLLVTVEGLQKSVGDDGRIHTTYSQTVASTGRLSSTDPNLQNVPIRTAEGRRIRQAFVVGAGFETLLTADYSQVEMRIMAHLSGDEALIEAFASGEDLHTTVASRVFDVPPGEVTLELRARIKAMSYGLAYGLSPYGLGQQLGIPPEEARVLMDEYFERFGGVRDYLNSVVDEARRTGYTETLMGRRRYLPDLTSDNRQRREMAERMALNAPIQGSAADIIKVAMLGVERSLLADGLGVATPSPGSRRAGPRGGCGGGVSRGGARPSGDGRRLPAAGAVGRVRGRRPHLGRRRPLSAVVTAARRPGAAIRRRARPTTAPRAAASDRQAEAGADADRLRGPAGECLTGGHARELGRDDPGEGRDGGSRWGDPVEELVPGDVDRPEDEAEGEQARAHEPAGREDQSGRITGADEAQAEQEHAGRPAGAVEPGERHRRSRCRRPGP